VPATIVSFLLSHKQTNGTRASRKNAQQPGQGRLVSPKNHQQHRAKQRHKAAQGNQQPQHPLLSSSSSKKCTTTPNTQRAGKLLFFVRECTQQNKTIMLSSANTLQRTSSSSNTSRCTKENYNKKNHNSSNKQKHARIPCLPKCVPKRLWIFDSPSSAEIRELSDGLEKTHPKHNPSRRAQWQRAGLLSAAGPGGLLFCRLVDESKRWSKNSPLLFFPSP
jgi:hypothetical protein